MTRFSERREQLYSELGDGLAVVAGAEDGRQDASFFFLTGCEEPGSVALFRDGRFTLFVRPRDAEVELWEGTRIDASDARERFGADDAFTTKELDEKLRDALLSTTSLWYCFGSHFDSRVVEILKREQGTRAGGFREPLRLEDLGAVIDELRLRKTPEEIDALRRACAITCDGHRAGMQLVRPGLYEFQVQAAVEGSFRAGGSQRNSFGTIVGSGPNACILHHERNDRLINDGELVLIDAGAEFEYLCGDVTRTMPASGTFTGPQRELYEIVLRALHEATAAAVSGALHRDVHQTARRVITEGLVATGLLPRSVDESLAMNHDRVFFPHGTSHWLGLDTHDVGGYRLRGEHRVLEPSMAITVEPGLYVDARETVPLILREYSFEDMMERRVRLGLDAAKKLEEQEREGAEKIEHPVPEHFRGIGIRIENDVLITSGGPEVLTPGAPTGASEVEQLVRS